MKTKLFIAALAASLAVPAYAGLSVGDTVDDVDFTTLYGQTISVYWDQWGGSKSVGAGIYNVSTSAGAFQAFCIDLAQLVPNGVDGYLVDDLADAPDPYVAPGGMGTTRANDLARLWASHRSSIASPEAAAAFQLAVWEVVYETGGSYDLTNGDLQTTDPGHARAGEANALLGSLGGSAAGNLVALVYNAAPSQYQDFLVQVPTPGSILLGSLGVGIVGWIRRGRTL